MITRTVSVLISLLIVGCMPTKNLTIYPPQTAIVQLPVTPDVAITRAAKVAAQMGGDIHLVPGQPHMLQAQNIHRAVLLVVDVKPHGTGSEVTVNGSVSTTRIVTGTFDEVQVFVARLQQEK